ncbi:MAG: type 1 glutamine amidotransferase domain-containing protein [Flavobacterium sp. BFFFF1]|uniref:type 1 glutamine amidotransferase domain-containing protein n=1 Tax=unclassified Flavobacterium TaxID=196869 RepID=UPI000BCD1468|nr:MULTISPECIES: type 1 glutamine amidotransferase domain-containing protein [unclassified Flavobacterium]OYU80641.1 MAG: type 1 glutamine amidotransferase domain-containing protein [Flavobacterium sp. BFFFF1]
MSHKNLNPVNAKKPKRIAIVLSNPANSSTTGWPVGFWWSELTHPYYHLTEKGHEVEIFSYFGGKCEADAMSNPEDPSQWQAEDVISRGYLHDPAFLSLLEHTKPAAAIDVNAFDAIIFAGGQGPMFTIAKAHEAVQKFADFYEAGKLAVALCHGVAVLRHAKLSDGTFIAAGKTITGFANVEEDFADEAVWNMGALPRGQHLMPWRIEEEMRSMGANFIQAGLWKGFAIRDGNLITGQQNFSGTETAEVLLKALGE